MMPIPNINSFRQTGNDDRLFKHGIYLRKKDDDHLRVCID